MLEQTDVAKQLRTDLTRM